MTRSDTLQTVYRYLQATVFLAVVVAILTVLSAVMGCATKDGKVTVDPGIVTMMSTDLGYVAYRTVPDARPTLDALCILTSMSDPVEFQDAMVKSLQSIWTAANETDATVVVLTINNLVGIIKLQTQIPTPEIQQQWRDAAKALCVGVHLATKGPQA